MVTVQGAKLVVFSLVALCNVLPGVIALPVGLPHCSTVSAHSPSPNLATHLRCLQHHSNKFTQAVDNISPNGRDTTFATPPQTSSLHYGSAAFYSRVRNGNNSHTNTADSA